MLEITITGPGTIVGRWGDLWAIHNGMSEVYVAPANMLIEDPKPGQSGVLTYEYRGLSRVGCFRGDDDPALQGDCA